MQVAGIPVTRRSSRRNLNDQLSKTNRRPSKEVHKEHTIARALHADSGRSDVVAAQLPGELSTILRVLSLRRLDGKLASNTLLLAVRDGGGNSGGATEDTTSSTGPGGGRAHLNGDGNSNDGKERSRGVLAAAMEESAAVVNETILTGVWKSDGEFRDRSESEGIRMMMRKLLMGKKLMERTASAFIYTFVEES
jgi:hypothetical protein